MSKFYLKQDWKYINWKATLITNLYRSVAAGIVWMIIMLFTDLPLSNVIVYPIVFPLVYFAILLPIGLLSSLLSRMGIPFIGLLSILFCIFIIPGDPILWIFNKITKEHFVPVKYLSFITFAIILFVVDEDKKAAS